MSETRTSRRSGSSRGRRQAAEIAARRRRRWGFGSAGVTVLLVAGVILGLHYANRPAHTAAATTAATPAAGRRAPNGTFTTLAGTTASIASLRGTPALVWFVTTWCSSCQAGTKLLAQNITKLHADGVRVIEVELHGDLGQSGPPMAQFAKVLAGAEYANPAWTFGVASAALTRTYDPQSDLEVYYLLNAKGEVTDVNAPLVSTMPQLLQAAGKLR